MLFGRGGSMSRESVAVRIAGHEYKIRSDGDSDSLREIAVYVDRAIQRVRERTGTVDTLEVAVLTCLNLAREILSLHESRLPEGSAAIEGDRLRSLIEQVESVIGGAATDAEAQATSRVSEVARDEPEAGEPEPPRTLELPSVESLREGPDAEEAGDEPSELPEPRVAAGGRDRAS